jgi:hypothetical protein
LRQVLIIVGALAFALLGRTEQLAMMVLNTEAWTGGQLPAGWQVKVNRGTPQVSVAREGDSSFLHLKSQSSSYGLERSVDVDPTQLPYLSWRWKVTALPEGGDFRRARTDDQAAQVLVAFTDRRVLTYLWDTTAPKGTMQSASSIPLIRIFAVVCESGARDANRWIREVRNVREDYEKAFGRSAVKVKGIRLQINSQHTGSNAESYFGEVSFRSHPQ